MRKTTLGVCLFNAHRRIWCEISSRRFSLGCSAGSALIKVFTASGDPISVADVRFRRSGGAGHPATAIWVCRHNFMRLCTVHINRHSARIAASPLSENCRKPSTCFNWPKIGSMIPFRLAYFSRPFLVRLSPG